MIVPLDQRLVADVDGDHDVVELLRQLDAALDLCRVLEGIGRQLLVGDRLVQPGASLVIAELGVQPDSQQDLDRQIVSPNDLERLPRVLAGVVHANQMEVMSDQDLEILENLLGTRIHGPVAAIGMLPFPESRIGDGHDLAGQQVLGGLFQAFGVLGCVRTSGDGQSDDGSRSHSFHSSSPHTSGELKGFARIPFELAEAQRVRFTLTADQLAFYALGSRRVVEPDAFKV